MIVLSSKLFTVFTVPVDIYEVKCYLLPLLNIFVVISPHRLFSLALAVNKFCFDLREVVHSRKYGPELASCKITRFSKHNLG